MSFRNRWSSSTTATTQKESHMSVTNTYAGVGVAVRDSRTNHGGENTAAAGESTETTRRFANELLVAGEPVAVDEFVARGARSSAPGGVCA
jgi:hypothetical protein